MPDDFEFEKEDFGLSDDFGTGVETPIPDADDFKIPQAADAMKPVRGEAHREAQRKGALNQWKARDRIEGVPPRAESSKVPPLSKRGAIEALLLKQQAESPHIQKAIKEYVATAVQELGGWPNLTASKKAMLLCQRIALLIILAAEEAIVASKGLLDADGQPHPLLRTQRDYLATFRQGEISLGLGLRSRMPSSDNSTIASVMQEYASKKTERPLLVPEKPSKKASKDKGG